jgi:hypothetical protein
LILREIYGCNILLGLKYLIFNADIFPQFEGEIQLIEKWCKIVNAQLNSSLVAEKV